MVKSKKFKLILLLAGLTFFAYLSSLGNPFIWDDEQFITRNLYVQQFDIGKIFTQNTIAGAGQLSNYYRPLTSLSFAIDKILWGQNTFGFHLTNLTLHIGAGIFLFLLLTELSMGEVGAFFVSLFFLIFPTQTEAITYINSRGDSMFGFWFLLSLFTWVMALKKNKKIFFLVSAFSFALSILGKETALFGLPIFGVVLWFYTIEKKQNIKKILSKLSNIMFLGGVTAVAGIYFLLRLTVLNFSNTLNYYTIQTEYSTHLFLRLFTFCKILFVYLGIILFPYPLHMERSVDYVRSPFSVWVIGAILFISILFCFCWFVYRKIKNPWLLFGFLWSSFFMLAVSGIIPLNGLLYEHWLYMPIIGFWIMVYGVWKAFSKQLHKLHVIMISFGIVLASLYIILTIRQNNIWSDPVVFYEYTLSYAPTSARMHNNLGMTLANEGKYKESIPEYKKAIQIESGLVEAHNNLANAYGSIGVYDLAEQEYKKAIQIAPNFLLPQTSLIKLYLFTKQYGKARVFSKNDPQVEKIIQELQHASTN